MSDNIILLVVVVILIVIILCLITKKNREPFKTYGGYSPMCPFKSNDGCAWSKEGTGPMCQIDKKKTGCPACCGNIDWYLGPKGYNKKCPVVFHLLLRMLKIIMLAFKKTLFQNK